MVKIDINLKKLEEQESLLRKLRNSISNPYEISLQTSQGDTVEQIKRIAKELEAIRQTFSVVIDRTEKALKLTREGFKNADETVSQYWDV